MGEDTSNNKSSLCFIDDFRPKRELTLLKSRRMLHGRADPNVTAPSRRLQAPEQESVSRMSQLHLSKH